VFYENNLFAIQNQVHALSISVFAFLHFVCSVSLYFYIVFSWLNTNGFRMGKMFVPSKKQKFPPFPELKSFQIPLAGETIGWGVHQRTGSVL
jgi:hypothetical protein